MGSLDRKRGDSSANREAQRENAGAWQERAGVGGGRGPSTDWANWEFEVLHRAIVRGPWSLPDLAPGDREGRVPAPSWRVRREFGWSEKEMRVSGIYGFLQGMYKFLEPPPSLILLFFAQCVPAFIYFQTRFPF